MKATGDCGNCKGTDCTAAGRESLQWRQQSRRPAKGCWTWITWEHKPKRPSVRSVREMPADP